MEGRTGGTTWFRGKVNEPANVKINGQNARVDADGTFESLTSVGPGVQDVAMQATDAAGNTTSQTWRVDNGPAGTVTTTHDPEGNLLTDGRYTYTWDKRNRMTSVTLGADTWTFQYDGQNRRIAESKNGTPTRQWFWHGTRILEERLANGTKIRHWEGGFEVLDNQGQQSSKRIVLNDHLGSARVVLDGSTGAVTASYDYSPWGLRTRIQGTEDWGTGYTGHLWHESGLSLAVYRPYDPHTGRWPSRDPIGEKGGHNLTCYADNSPISSSDYLGLMTQNELNRVILGTLAAVKATAELAPHSRAEYAGAVCGKVCRDGRKLRFTTHLRPGGRGISLAPKCPSGWYTIADFHSHPDTTSGISRTDRSNWTGTPRFVGELKPNGFARVSQIGPNRFRDVYFDDMDYTNVNSLEIKNDAIATAPSHACCDDE